MDHGEALDAGLPPHRDDEPPALRRDIWIGQGPSSTLDEKWHLMADVSEADRPPLDPGRSKWRRWPYQVSALMVLKPIEAKDLPAGRRRYAVVAGVTGASPNPEIPTCSGNYVGPPEDEELKGALQLQNPYRPLLTGYLKRIGSPPFDSPTRETRFEPSLDHPNEWTIPFPEELAQELRKALKKPSPLYGGPHDAYIVRRHPTSGSGQTLAGTTKGAR